MFCPIITTAKDALQELTSNPVAQHLAREQEAAVLLHWHLIDFLVEHGRAQGPQAAQRVVRAACNVLEYESVGVVANNWGA